MPSMCRRCHTCGKWFTVGSKIAKFVRSVKRLPKELSFGDVRLFCSDNCQRKGNVYGACVCVGNKEEFFDM